MLRYLIQFPMTYGLQTVNKILWRDEDLERNIRLVWASEVSQINWQSIPEWKGCSLLAERLQPVDLISVW